MSRLAILAAASALLSLPARALDDAAAAKAVDFANRQLALTAAALTPQLSPGSTRPDGSWETFSNTDPAAWTQGFFPASNWYVYDLTGDPLAKARADQWTRALEAQKTNTATHDLGFAALPRDGRGALDAALVHVEDPGEAHDEGEPDGERDDEVGEDRIRPVQTVHDGLHDLQHSERGDAVAHEGAEDATTLQLRDQ